MEKKHKFILQGKFAVILFGMLFCKIDLKLDIISFLERLLKVCDSQNSQFFDPSSTLLYILYNCEWVSVKKLFIIFIFILYLYLYIFIL